MNTDPYRIFPPARPEQRAELFASIEAVGLKCPVVMDEHGDVIDGHERRDICNALGLDWMAGADVQIGLSQDAKKALAIDLNLRRRRVHLPRVKLNELIDIYLIAHPELSGPLIADLFGVSQPTVSRRKEQLIQMNKLKPIASTVGKDGKTRRVGKRGSRLIVKSRNEFEKLMPHLQEVEADLSGIIRRPKRFASEAVRKRKLEAVAEVAKLPPNIRIEHCDFRDLKIKRNSVDLILTDVVWSLEKYRDWQALANMAWKRHKPDGLFASIIGTSSLIQFGNAVSESLYPLGAISVVMTQPYRDFRNGSIQGWRAVPLFSPDSRRKLFIYDVIHSPNPEKEYHDWQQSLPVAKDLVRILSSPKSVIVDPHLGTGTNAVAVALSGQGRRFIGCDIDAEMVRIARHRVDTEGREEAA